MKTRSEPFRRIDGRLFVEDVDLAVLAGERAGRPAWLLSHVALTAAITATRGSATVPVARVGPPAVLALLADAGLWARAASSHELSLALGAGFEPAQVVASAPVLDDGFVKDALSAGVGRLLRPDQEAALNVARIAAALALRQPAAEDGPPDLPPDAFVGCGGLLAPVLSGPPGLALDALWERSGRAMPRVLAVRQPPLDALSPEARRAARATQRISLRGLGQAQGVPARLSGLVERGDWVVVADDDAPAVRVPHPAWPLPDTVLVRGEAWRVLDERPLPGRLGPAR